MMSQNVALLWCVDHSKGENYHFMTNTPGKFDLSLNLYFASYVQLSQSDGPIKMHKIFFGNRITKIILPSAIRAVRTILFKKHKGNLHTIKNFKSVSVYN